MLIRFVVALCKAPLDFIFTIKWALAYVAIRLYNACHCRRFDLYDASAIGDPVKLGFVVPQLEKDLESPMPESHLREAADEVFFYGVNSKSECVLVRIARGCNQVAEAWIYLKLADGKTYHLSESFGYQQPFEGKCLKFSCGRLQMQFLSPMRRWRIYYCGMLKETSLNRKDQEDVFVKFTFLWSAASNVYDLTLDSNIDGFARSLARANWKIPFIPPVIEFANALNFYAQSGVVHGTVSVNDGSDYEMYLFGEKVRSTGKSANIVGCKFTNILGNSSEYGLSFHVTKASAPYIFHNLPFGFVVQPDGNMGIVKELDINIKPHRSKRSGNSFQTVFEAGEKFDISGKIIGDPVVLYSGEGWSGFLEVCFIEFVVQNKKGSGLILSGEVYKEPKRQSIKIESISLPQNIPLTVKLSDEVCQIVDISGGKGSSLGKLMKLSSELKSFRVPRGLIVTTLAFSEFLTREIMNEIKELENIAYGNIKGDLKVACKQVYNAIVKTLLPSQICQSILRDLKDMYNNEVNKYKFAVRSSATAEDTETMSSAGQMDTFLGVQGLKDMFLAVKKCWASQFSYNAVEYKRRNGQILNSPMAVVIQEMVSCEVSGVIFTCDPVTNNPAFIAITANYGLGETVVSGSVEPDTIILRKKPNEQVEVHSVTVGTKLQKIVIQDSGGTVTENVSENSRNESCLSKELSERLGRLAIKIEKHYKSPRDIEWGIVNNTVHILQSRPLTNTLGLTEFEIEHEFDSPLRSEREYITIANTGEVMPGSTSTLGMELIFKIFSLAFKKQAASQGDLNNILNCNYYTSGMLMFSNHLMMTVAEMIGRYGVDTPMSKAFMVSVFGRILDDPELLEFTRERVKEGPASSIMSQIRYYKDLFFHASVSEKAKKEVENYHFNFLKCNTATEIFAALLESCDHFCEPMRKHLDCSGCSSNWNMYLFSILCSDKKNLDSNVYSDFAMLLASSSNIESADIPQAMQSLSDQIGKDIESDRFKAMSVEEAEMWLESSPSSAGQKFRKFIKRHGHRCLKEFDIRSITWELDSKPLVKVLQNMTGTNKQNEKKVSDDENIFSELHSSLSFHTKWALKNIVLPYCRKAVRAREATKPGLLIIGEKDSDI